MHKFLEQYDAIMVGTYHYTFVQTINCINYNTNYELSDYNGINVYSSVINVPLWWGIVWWGIMHVLG